MRNSCEECEATAREYRTAMPRNDVGGTELTLMGPKRIREQASRSSPGAVGGSSPSGSPSNQTPRRHRVSGRRQQLDRLRSIPA